jgi:hypothetical protein
VIEGVSRSRRLLEADVLIVGKRPVPTAWHPDASLPHEERCPNRVPAGQATLTGRAT